MSDDDIKDKLKKMNVDYDLWQHAEYTDQLKLDEIKSKKLLQLSKQFNVLHSSVYRNDIFQNLKFNLKPQEYDMSYTVFRIERQDEESSLNFAILYSRLYNGKVKNLWLTLGSTFKSMDGEFRLRFIPFKQIKWVWKNFKSVFDTTEEYIIGGLGKDFNIISEVFFNPATHPPNMLTILQDNVRNNRLDLYLYLSLFTVEMPIFLSGDFPNHLPVKWFLCLFGKREMVAYKLLTKKFDSVELFDVRQHIEMYMNLYTYKPTTMKFGQKLIPLSIAEMKNPYNIRYNAWREIRVNSLVTDLVINNICPGFALLGHVFFLENTREGLFDNRNMKDKIIASKELKVIARELNKIKDQTQIYKGFVNRIEEPIDHLDVALTISTIAVGFTVDYVGRTLFDMPRLLLNNPVAPRIGDVFNDMDWFSKYMFDFIYTLYCCNSKYGVMQGDLHLNNLTINYKNVFNMAINPETTKKIQDMQPHSIYRLHPRKGKKSKPGHLIFDDQDDNDHDHDSDDDINMQDDHDEPLSAEDMEHEDEFSYIFKYQGAYGCIIDFSRCIMNRDTFTRMYINPEVPILKKGHTKRERDIRKYLEYQARSVEALYQKHFPDFSKKYENILYYEILENFEEFFVIATAFDMYSVALYLEVHLEDLRNADKERDKNFDEEQRKYAQRISGKKVFNWSEVDETTLKNTKEDEPLPPAFEIKNQSGILPRPKMVTFTEEIPKFLQRIQNICKQYLINKVTKYFETRDIKVIQNLEFPMFKLLSVLFNDYKVSNFKGDIQKITLCDIFDFKNSIKYTSREYEKFPPAAKWDWIHEYEKKHDIKHEWHKRVAEFFKSIEPEEEERSAERLEALSNMH